MQANWSFQERRNKEEDQEVRKRGEIIYFKKI